MKLTPFGLRARAKAWLRDFLFELLMDPPEPEEPAPTVTEPDSEASKPLSPVVSEEALGMLGTRAPSARVEDRSETPAEGSVAARRDRLRRW